MGPMGEIVVAIVVVCAMVLIALFGHVPSLRNTPIGWIHRFVLKKIPAGILAVDRALTGGSLTSCLMDCGSYVINEKHPLIIIFYLLLMSGGMYMFFMDAFQFLTPTHKIISILTATLPFITLYAAVYSDPGFITRDNHARALQMYPYDNINFFQGKICRTCLLEKPARSKHCSLCRRCVAKMDHHCVWINNCVGHNNTRHFLAFLFATTYMLLYGAWQTANIITRYMMEQFHPGTDVAAIPWMVYLKLWCSWMLELTFIGAVFLLASLCSTLSIAFTAYHLYLIYCGTTTNESAKWSDWEDDIKHGEIYRAINTHGTRNPNQIPWPNISQQCLYHLGENNTRADLPPDFDWKQVQGLAEVDNIYDLGFWENLKKVLWPAPL